MKSCVIQMPRRAAAGGERLPIPTPADGHGAAWCCWAEPAPASAPAQALHSLTRTPPAARFSSRRAGPCAQCCRSRSQRDSSVRLVPSPPGTRPSPPGTCPSSWSSLPLRELGWSPAPRGRGHCPWGAGTSLRAAGHPLRWCHECPRHQGLVLRL